MYPSVEPHSFDADAEPDPIQNLTTDQDPEPGWGGGGEMSSKKVDPPGKILGAHLLSGWLQGEGGGGAHDRNLA